MNNRPVAGADFQHSDAVAEAAWLEPRLSSFDSGEVRSVVPDGFESYARLLHPLHPPVDSQRPVRWREVAAWSGIEITSGVQFPDLAFPEHEPAGAEPWPGHVPQVGSLHPADAQALAAVLARHTSTPGRCWFCLWEGWGALALPASRRVEFPARSYVLFTGPLSAVLSLITAHDGYSPNLWWPDDRAWCVATEIDLPWTYVGGSDALVGDVLADAILETQPASPSDDLRQRVPAWLADTIEDAVSELLDSGTTTLATWRGTVHAQLQLPRGHSDGDLRVTRKAANGLGGSGWQRITERDATRLRDNLRHDLTADVVDLI